ncbi:MAG: carbohydrate ABC transporter permease [Betaproteobacteria bacterium]|nr:carbohydrate ABC transporter permease [Betaproteobacteria bacterium]MBK7080453.1 carbohydrate ABC transporter permease [Betaproteobacteria bacterium]MBK7591538.1 carbohydrate ABC transporter permease [Betaproteobacteria bacterium]MBK8688950.1 carbohydrate ABC transporter permease [Betaproteobacteria bacterium]
MLVLATPLARAVFFGVLLVFGIFLFFPLFWMLSTSLKPEGEIFVRMPTLLPAAPTLVNYANAVTRGDLLLHLRNSLVTAGGGALLTVALGMYAAYGFAKYRYRGRTPLMYLMLSAQMFPFAVLLISLYPLLQRLGLLDTRIGLVIAYIVLALPSGTYMMYSYFVNIPSEIIEAARADGAGELFIFHRIVLPLAVPALVTVGLYAFMWAWNDLLFALTLITSADKRTVGPGLLLTHLGESRNDWGAAMAASIVSSLPVVVAFGFLQRFFIKGLTAGAVKS